MVGRHMLGLGGLIVLLAANSPAAAFELAGEAAPVAIAPESPEPPLLVIPAPEAPGLQVLTDEDLADDALSGKGSVAVSMTDQDLTAVNTGNYIHGDNVGSGAISMSDAALSGFNGIGNFTLNTGHNNNLQSSLSVTVIVTP